MSSVTILIEKYGTGHAVAAVEKGVLIDFLVDPMDPDKQSPVGSIVTARLNSTQKGINGTFVTLPNHKKGFLKSTGSFPSHSIIPVYIDLLAESHKAQPVNEKIILKGRYIILTPKKPGINISRQIKSEIDRERLLNTLSKFERHLPENCGLIFRSQAINVKTQDLIREIDQKIHDYRLILEDDLSEPRVIIEPKKAREQAMDDWGFAQTSALVEDVSCFDRYGVWEQVSKFLKNRVNLDNGGFLMIETTSAFNTVDINTGSDVSYAGALKTNLFAMRELPRQLEIRGLGGKIVVEFAPLSKKDRTKIESELKKSLGKYKSKSIVVGWTKLGNLELQKKRHKIPIFDALRSDTRFDIF